jgi:hypothetical protein
MVMKHLVSPMPGSAEDLAWGPGFARLGDGFPCFAEGRVLAGGAEEEQAGDAGGRVTLFF